MVAQMTGAHSLYLMEMRSAQKTERKAIKHT